MIKLNLGTLAIRAAFAMSLVFCATLPGHAQSAAETPVLADKSVAAELAFWNSIKDSNNASDFKTYLENFPNGMFFDPAMQKFEQAGGNKSELIAPTAKGTTEVAEPPVPVTGASKKADVKSVKPIKKISRAAVIKPATKIRRNNRVANVAKQVKLAAPMKRKKIIVHCGTHSVYRNNICVALTVSHIKKKSQISPAKRKPPTSGNDGGGGGGGGSGGGGGWT